MRSLPALAVVFTVTLATAACAADDANRVTVFTASSLTDVVDDLAEQWEAAGGSEVVAVLGGRTTWRPSSATARRLTRS